MNNHEDNVLTSSSIQKLIMDNYDGTTLTNPMLNMLCHYFDQINNNVTAIKEETQNSIKDYNKENTNIIKEMNKKLDKTNKLLSNVIITLSILETKFDEHLKSHIKEENRNKLLNNNIMLIITSLGGAIIGSLTTLKVANLI